MNLISIIFSIAAAVSSVVGYAPQPAVLAAPAPIVVEAPSPILGAAPSPIAGSTYNLAGSGVSSSATTITLQSLTIKQSGQKILTADLRQGASDTFYVTLDPGNNTRQEIVGCTGVTQNLNSTATLTGCSRGLSPIYPYAASTTLSFTHAGGAQAIFGDAPQLFNDFANYVASAVVSGAVDSSITVKGIVEVSTAGEAGSNAQIGSGNTTAPLVLTSSISSSTRKTSGLSLGQIVVASTTTGYIDNSYIATSTAQGGSLALFNNVVMTGTTTMASTTYIGAFPAYQIGMNSQTFAGLGTSTFSIPNGITKVRVRLVGAGGGGGGSNASAASCGAGAGAYWEGTVDVTGTTSVQVHVGEPGTGGTNAPTAGSTGTWSTFGTNGFYVSVNGGGGGAVNTCGGGGTGAATTTPAGGSLVTTAFSVPGGDGRASIAADPSGGPSFFGGSTVGGNGIVYGVGGNGRNNSGGGTLGGPGVVIINW